MCERKRVSVRERNGTAATKLLHNIISAHARKTLNDDLPIVVSDASVRIDRFATSRIAHSTSWFCQFQIDCNIAVYIFVHVNIVIGHYGGSGCTVTTGFDFVRSFRRRSLISYRPFYYYNILYCMRHTWFILFRPRLYSTGSYVVLRNIYIKYNSIIRRFVFDS